MPSQRKLFTTLLTSAALLASPSAALAQSAGDQQYADPLADTPSQDDSGSGNAGSQGNSGNSGSQGNPGNSGSGTAATPSQAAPDTSSQPDAAAQGQALPRTGSDSGLLLAAGAVLLGSGMLLRVGVTARRGAV